MMRDIDNYFLKKEEPVKSCLLFLRDFILTHNENITEAWRYQMPFYLYKGKRFCYLWVQKKTQFPYLGLVDGKLVSHPKLIQENRSRMKIFLMNPEKDIPMKTLKLILEASLKPHKKNHRS